MLIPFVLLWNANVHTSESCPSHGGDRTTSRGAFLSSTATCLHHSQACCCMQQASSATASSARRLLLLTHAAALLHLSLQAGAAAGLSDSGAAPPVPELPDAVIDSILQWVPLRRRLGVCSCVLQGVGCCCCAVHQQPADLAEVEAGCSAQAAAAAKVVDSVGAAAHQPAH